MNWLGDRRAIARRQAILGCLICAVVLFPLAGCRTDTKMSKQEEENFKGGPMPPGFLEKNGGTPPGKPAEAAVARKPETKPAP